jgi:integrase
VLNLILNWGRQRGRIKLNPLRDAGVKNLYTGTRRDQVWTPELAAAFCAEAPSQLRLGFMLAYWTGQRQGDLVRLPWSAYDGETITLTQSKGGVPVAVPAAAPLKALLDWTPRNSPMILVNQDGRPWSEWGFGFMFSKTKNKLGMPALTFHDLRGTVASDLQDAGCTEAQITAVKATSSLRTKCSTRIIYAAIWRLRVLRSHFWRPTEAAKRVSQNICNPLTLLKPKNVFWKNKLLILFI